MLNQAIARKRCASCERWGGTRQAGDALPDQGIVSVVVEDETAVGLCRGGPWDNSERRARSACGHWTRWSALGPGEAI